MSTFISCVELRDLMRARTNYFAYIGSGQLRPGMMSPDEPPGYSIFDVRHPEDFHASRITHKEEDPIEMCLNIDPNFITPWRTGEELETLVVRSTEDRRQQTLIRHRDSHYVDVIILVDWESTEKTVTMKNRLVALQTILTEMDPGHPPPRYMILDGGFKQWLQTYPELTTNSMVPIPEDWISKDLPQSVKVTTYFAESSVTLPEYPDFEPSFAVDVSVTEQEILTKILQLQSEIVDMLRDRKRLEAMSAAKVRELLKRVEKKLDCGQAYGDEVHKLDEQLEDLIPKIGAKEKELEEMQRIIKKKMHLMFDDRVKKASREREIENLKKQIAKLQKGKQNLLGKIICTQQEESTREEAVSDVRPGPEDAPQVRLSLQESFSLRRHTFEPGLSQEKSSEGNLPMEIDIEIPTEAPPRQSYHSEEEMNPDSGKTKPGTTGLQNPSGYICYANSIIQLLSHSPPIKNFFIKKLDNIGGDITRLVNRVMKMLWSGQYKSFSIEVLRERVGELKPTFSNKNQQDSQEFVTELLQILHEELKEEKVAEVDDKVQSPQEAMDIVLEGKSSIIAQTFYGQTRSFIVCQTCGLQSSNRNTAFDAFTTLIVALPEDGTPDLENCIDNSLVEMKSRVCPQCRHEQPAKVVQLFSQLPPVLIVVLNRFVRIPEKNAIEKNKIPMIYPLKMELKIGRREAPERKVKYQLIGVCCHHGELGGGHYYSYCRHLENERWYRFNDSYVEKVSPKDVLVDKKKAYVLFYSQF